MNGRNNEDSKFLLYLGIFFGILLLVSVCSGGGGGDYDAYDNARRALR